MVCACAGPVEPPAENGSEWDRSPAGARVDRQVKSSVFWEPRARRWPGSFAGWGRPLPLLSPLPTGGFAASAAPPSPPSPPSPPRAAFSLPLLAFLFLESPSLVSFDFRPPAMVAPGDRWVGHRLRSVPLGTARLPASPSGVVRGFLDGRQLSGLSAPVCCTHENARGRACYRTFQRGRESDIPRDVGMCNGY